MGDAGRVSPAAVRFLGVAQPPAPDWNLLPVELDESDVVWSAAAPAPPTSSRRIAEQRSGLSAALSSEGPAVRRGPRLCRSVSDVREVPPPPPGAQAMQSAPIKVPAGCLARSMSDRFFDAGGGFDGEEEVLPPHEMVARAQKMATLSVVEGAGRTLKGRDLRRVRNAVWQQTGFLD